MVERLVVLEGPVHLLHVGEDDLGVQAAGTDHLLHVVTGDEVRDAGESSGGGGRGGGLPRFLLNGLSF